LLNHPIFIEGSCDPQEESYRKMNIETGKRSQDSDKVNFMVIPQGQTGAMDALLASYASGSLSRPLHAVVASHLSLKADNRYFVSSMENLIAEDMAAMPVSTAPRDRDTRLSTIFDSDLTAVSNSDDELGASFVPAPLMDYIGRSYESLKWRTVMPGLREVTFENAPGCEASLLWIKAGRAMPSHTHPGMEATLVLKGSFADATGYYGRGDLAVVDSDVDHKPVAGADEDCICFAVSEGPVKLTGPIARLFQKLIRH
jgi:putative transcriptional regulator